MKTIYDLKEEIKELAQVQSDLKAQRKQRYQGKRTHSQSQATWEAQRNKRKLRRMHIAYSLLRGWSYEQIEPKVKENSYIPINEAVALAKEYNGEETVHFDS